MVSKGSLAGFAIDIMENCLECGKPIEKTDKEQYVCRSCYDKLVQYEKETIRKLISFEAPDHIIDHIHIGGERSAIDLTYLQKSGFTDIVVTAIHCETLFKDQGISYRVVDVDDCPKEDIKKYFKEVYQYIKGCKGNVLVHCVSGISRSVSFVIAYLMLDKGWDLEKSLAYIRSKRSCASPNSGFKQQLREFEKEIYSTHSTTK